MILTELPPMRVYLLLFNEKHQATCGSLFNCRTQPYKRTIQAIP